MILKHVQPREVMVVILYLGVFGDLEPHSREHLDHLLLDERYRVQIARSAFHWSAVQYTPEEKPVYFDSSSLFKAGRRDAG